MLQHDMAYGDFKDLEGRTASDKVLRDKAFNIAKNPNYDGYQRGLPSMVYKFFDKNSKGRGVNIPLEFNKQLAEKLQKTIIRNLKKRTVYLGLKDNIWGADLADMRLISKSNNWFRFLLCVSDITVNMLGLFLWKIKKVLVLSMCFKKYKISQDVNLTKYG